MALGIRRAQVNASPHTGDRFVSAAYDLEQLGAGGLDALKRSLAVRGLIGLVLLFDYMIYQQLQIHRVRRELDKQGELFRLITVNAADMIAVVEIDGRRIYNSPSYERILGYTLRRASRQHPHSNRYIPMTASLSRRRRQRHVAQELAGASNTEEEHPTAGRMVEEWIQHSDGDPVLDAPELAVRLLEGCELLSGPEIPDHVRAWLEATIGPASRPPDTRVPLHGPKLEAIPDHEMTFCAERVLDACPDWLDRSPLTCELAEEIALREGRATPDPVRDAGAYRYLFEHLLIDRLELYARMLLWMAWLWHADGRPELARSAFALAAQLSDEQYAVPSHPFTVALTTRSLLAAQAERLRTDGSNADA